MVARGVFKRASILKSQGGFVFVNMMEVGAGGSNNMEQELHSSWSRRGEVPNKDSWVRRF